MAVSLAVAIDVRAGLHDGAGGAEDERDEAWRRSLARPGGGTRCAVSAGFYREFRYWSPLLGGEAVRLSVTGGEEAAIFHGAGAAGAEYFAIIEASSGRSMREARERAFEAIDRAIRRGDAPGEVRVEG